MIGRGRTARAVGLMAAVALLTAGATAGRPSTVRVDRTVDPACHQALGNAVRREMADGVPNSCWRVGPFQLGMSEAAVEQRLGAPVRCLAMPQGTATLYLLPAWPGPLVRNGHARFRLALLRFVGDELALIDNDPGSEGSVISAHCSSRNPMMKIDSNADVGPLLRFAGIAVGDPVARIAATFGREPSRNRSHDWYNYLPVPMSFDVDPDRSTIIGFAIARDEEMLTGEWPTVRVQVRYDPATCALTGVDVGLGS